MSTKVGVYGTEKLARSEAGIRAWKWTILLVVCILVIAFNRVYIPSMDYDRLNVIPILATLYVGFCLVALKRTCGQIGYVSRCLSADPSVRKPFGTFLFSPYVRSLVLMVLVLVVAEFSLRCFSYQRSLLYVRQGDLLFTPIPNQKYVEKISLTPSFTNSYGLRGGPVDTGSGKTMVLCLGDSITYGYGVDDSHSYPADLQRNLDQQFPGRFEVLNAGVDAYPVAFMDQKFLYLWNLGLRPQIAVVGYSFNEGGLGRLVDSDVKTKDIFASRVRMKNFLRSFALYNLIVENWARASYDKLKGRMVPGTNFRSLSKQDLANLYDQQMERLLNDLRSRHVTPVFLLFAGYDGRTGRYDDQGPFQVRFAEFAKTNNIVLLRSDAVLAQGEPQDASLQPFFIDQCHMNEQGTQKVADKLAEYLPTLSGERQESEVRSQGSEGLGR